MNIKSLTALEVYNLLNIRKNSILIDIRTNEEWQIVGVPVLNKGKLIFLSWHVQINNSFNKEFARQITSQINDTNELIFFLCRSGIRSREAANYIAKIGYIICYNIIDGFEGNGWKKWMEKE